MTGILVGSVSGIAGAIIGSWMTGKSQLAILKAQMAAEDARASMAEKRRLYARFLTAISEVSGMLGSIKDPQTVDQTRVLQNKIGLANAYNEMLIFGLTNVPGKARLIVDYLDECIKRVADNRNSKYDVSVLQKLLIDLQGAIREDTRDQ